MRFPSGSTLQRWVIPVLVLAAAVQIGALWIVNGRIVTSTQHSLNTQQGQISQAGTTAQEAQAEIDALLRDIRGLQVTVDSLRSSSAGQNGAVATLQNEIAALNQAINQLQAAPTTTTTNGAGSTGGQATPPSPTLCHGGPKHC